MTYPLSFGSHKNPNDGLCLLEACAREAGEPHSDHPECVCFVLSAFLRKVNDVGFFDNATRTRVLSPLISSLVSSRASEEVEKTRAYLLANSTLSEMLPLALKAYRMDDIAEVLEALPLLTPENIETARGQYVAGLTQIEHRASADEVSTHSWHLLTLAHNAAKGAIKALSQMHGPHWKPQAEEVALCAAHAYSLLSEDTAGDLRESTYSLMVHLLNRALLIR